MKKFKKDDFQDPYIDPSSGCLRNLWNINDPELLSRVETAFLYIRTHELDQDSCDLVRAYKEEDALRPGYPEGVFDRTFEFRHLKDIHRHLFQDVYEWAGQIRKVDLSKEETHFLPHSLIEQSAESIFTKLKQENYLEGLDANTFSEKAGYYLGEINRIHPFREGNWCAQWEFINRIAHYNGYHIKPIGYHIEGHGHREQMLEAFIEADKGQLDSIVSIIRKNLVDRNVLFERENSFMIGQKIFHAEIGQTYTGSIIGSTERYVMQMLKDVPDHLRLTPPPLVLHNRHSLSSTVTHDINKAVEISYPHGDIGLVRKSEKVKEMDSKGHNLEKKSHQHKEHEWER